MFWIISASDDNAVLETYEQRFIAVSFGPLPAS